MNSCAYSARIGCACSVAGGDLHVAHTLFALDVAAPVELAAAPLHASLPSGRVAAVAAEQVAPVDSLGVRVAFSALGSQTARLDVQIAIVGRGLDVHQVGV